MKLTPRYQINVNMTEDAMTRLGDIKKRFKLSSRDILMIGIEYIETEEKRKVDNLVDFQE